MARAMAGTAITNLTRGGVDYGTMTALVAFQDAPDIPYALGSGHVLAPRGAAVGDEIITAEGLLIGWLAGWTGERPDGITPHDADAALVQVIPSGVSPGVVGGAMTRTAAHRAFPGDSVRQFGKQKGRTAVRPFVLSPRPVPWFSGGGGAPSQGPAGRHQAAPSSPARGSQQPGTHR